MTHAGLLIETAKGITPIAERLFAARIAFGVVEDAADDALLAACGLDRNGDWPFEDITHDYYDSSFEFKDVRPDWAPTPEHLTACWALGFERCWICYTDGTEKYFQAPNARPA